MLPLIICELDPEQRFACSSWEQRGSDAFPSGPNGVTTRS